MEEEKLETDELNSQIIKNFDFLKEIGILDQIDSFKNEIAGLKDLLEESIELFNKQTMLDLVNYLTTKMLNKFIPSYLAFIIQDEINVEVPQIMCFKNMQQIDNNINIESLKPYRNFFMLSPTSITFEAFQVMLDDKTLTDPLLPLEPELVVPMMGLEGMYGFIVFGKKLLDKKYDKSEIKYIDWIMKFASVSLQNNIHYRRANIDFKTGLYNHSFLLRRLNEELARLKRHDLELAIMMFDIDFFKKVNDTYGHLAGDKIIYGISKIIDNQIRTEDVAARFGGEEFVVLLVNCDSNYAYEIAERIRIEIQDYNFVFEENTIKTSVSIGVCTANAKEFYLANQLLKNADCALYHSKENGRNKTSIYSKSLEKNHC